MGEPIFGPCEGTVSRVCTFTVHQAICVEIPLTFSATATADPSGIVCGDPEAGECPNQTLGCTYTQGFFKNHPDITDALISNAGGTIVLGIDTQGASFSVTAANKDVVFDKNVPTPPAPTDNNFNAQYQALYVQLLAANLNVLNGATCPFAVETIADANAFLASSPATGVTGAPAFTDALTLFNEGNAVGCPDHCPEDTNS